MTKRYVVRIQDRNGFERRAPLGAKTILGRQSKCDLVLPDEMVSRTHLCLECIDGECWAEDMGSYHGTYQDGERIKRIHWKPGSVLVLADGAYRLMLVHDRLEATESNINAILTTAQQITGEFDLEVLLQKSLDHLLSLSGQDRGFIMLPNGNNLEVFVQRNLARDIDSEICLSMSSVKQVFETGEPIWVSDLSTNEALRTRQSVVDLQLRTILCLPLSAKGKRIGVIYLDSRHLKQNTLERNAFEAIVGLCAIAIDRMRMFEESRRNSIMAAVGSVASNLVHDFKNILFLISGHAEILADLCDDPDLCYHVEQIQSSVDRLSAMTSNILEFARIRPMNKKPVDLALFLNNEISNWRTRTKEYDIDVTGGGPECIVNIEESKFISILNNLFTNSIESLVGFDIKGHIQLLWEVIPNGVVIRVIDNGKGIPKKLIYKVFEPFFSYGKEKGNGLGMATVKKFVEGHGGSISVESEVDKGTEVTIYLPRSENTAQKHEKNRETSDDDTLPNS